MPLAFPRRLALSCAAAACLAGTTAAAQPGTAQPNASGGRLTVPAGAAAVAPPMNLDALADSLEGRFKDRTVGYAIVVSFNNQEMETRAGGMARRAPDSPTRAMTVDERFNVASVSKLITGAAVMHAIHRTQPTTGRGPLYTPMHQYLPTGWQLGPGVEKITVRDLLRHYSGLRVESYSTWNELRQILATSQVADSMRAVKAYRNTNFGVLRLILPRLAPSRAGTVPSTPEGLANAYQAYVRQHVLQPSGVTGAECKPAANAPALAYQFPHGVGQPGGAFADETLTCGASGWNLSARDLAKFGRTLLYTDRILPPAVLQQMREGGMAIDYAPLAGNVTRTGHMGFFPGGSNPGHINTALVGLSNGVSVAVITNSQISTAPSGPGFNQQLDLTVYDVLAKLLPAQ